MRVVGLSLSIDLEGAQARELLDAVLALARQRDPRARLVDVDAPWWQRSFVALDVETTGFSPDSDRVIELGWVRYEGGREVERQGSLVRVDRRLPHEIKALTGIDDAMLACAPRFAELAPVLLETLESVDFVVAYNARFDRGFLRAELERARLALPSTIEFVDPLVFVRELDRHAGSKRLCEAARRHGVAIEAPHRALTDARAAAELLLRLAPRLPARTLHELLDAQERWARSPASSHAPSAQRTSAAALGAVGSIGGLKERVLGLFR